MQTETSVQLTQLMVRLFKLTDNTQVVTVSRDDGGCWDSLRHMELIFAVEDAFGIHFTEEDLASIRNYRQLVSRIEALRVATNIPKS